MGGTNMKNKVNRSVYFVMLLWCAASAAVEQKIIYLIPPRGYEKSPDNFFAINDPSYAWYDVGVAFMRFRDCLAKNGYVLKLTVPRTDLHDASSIICVDMYHNLAANYNDCVKKLVDMLKVYDKEKLILVALEPETVDPSNYELSTHKLFNNVVTCYDNFKGAKYRKFHYPKANFAMTPTLVPFKEKKLCTLIASQKSSKHPNELYSARAQVIAFFEKINETHFDFYGGRARNIWTRNFKNYKGPVPTIRSLRDSQLQAQGEIDKIECLKNYRFCFCYENTRRVVGYISEKIFDCFKAGCVPIYWGATNIEEYVPPQCFIKRESFKTTQDVYNFIKDMTEAEYQKYMDAIISYLKSEKVKLFSVDSFVNTLMSALPSISKG